MKRFAALLAVLALGAAVPPVAVAQLGPQNVPPELTQEEPESRVLEEDTGLTTRQLVLIFGGAAGVLAAIAWFIMRDARSAAPSTARERAASESGQAPKKKSAREREREQARKRSKAKAVRDQRKRNRPR